MNHNGEWRAPRRSPRIRVTTPVDGREQSEATDIATRRTFSKGLWKHASMDTACSTPHWDYTGERSLYAWMPRHSWILKCDWSDGHWLMFYNCTSNTSQANHCSISMYYCHLQQAASNIRLIVLEMDNYLINSRGLGHNQGKCSTVCRRRESY